MMSIFPAGGAGLRSKTDDVMRNIFGKTQPGAQATGSPTVLTGPRVPRHSSAWKDLLKFLKAEQGLRILDIGPTSPTNINFLTTLGHGVYMADVVNEALRGNWISAPDENGETPFDVEGFGGDAPGAVDAMPGQIVEILLIERRIEAPGMTKRRQRIRRQLPAS